jgi:hypothetical protein
MTLDLLNPQPIRLRTLSRRWFRAGETFRKASWQERVADALSSNSASVLSAFSNRIALGYTTQHDRELRLACWHWVELSGSLVSLQGSYLVDPASSHMLVSKIKPCMSKYKLLIL